MQEYTKTNEQPSNRRYFQIDENDCLIIPPKEIAPELYILGGFFNTHMVEFEKVVKQIAADNATNTVEDKRHQEQQQVTQDQITPTAKVEEAKNKIEDKVKEEKAPSIPLDVFANSYHQSVPQKFNDEYMDEDDFQPQPNLENIYSEQKQNNNQDTILKNPQDYIDSLNDELPPENISITVDEDDDIELYAQIDNIDYINSDVPSDEDIISEEEIQNGTGYELEKEYASSDEDTEDDSFSVL